MVRRWIIRLPFLLGLALIVAAWVMSYFGAMGVNAYIGGRFASVGAIHGIGRFFEVPTKRPIFTYFYFEPHTTIKDLGITPTSLGFGLSIGTTWGRPGSFDVAFPFWFPTLALLALCWFVWRKTKPRRIGGAFPIEPIANPKPPART